MVSPRVSEVQKLLPFIPDTNSHETKAVADQAIAIIESRHGISYKDAITDHLEEMERRCRTMIDFELEKNGAEYVEKYRTFLRQTLAIRRVDMPYNGHLVPAIEFRNAGIIISLGSPVFREMPPGVISSELDAQMPDQYEWGSILRSIPGIDRFDRLEDVKDINDLRWYLENLWKVL